MIHASRFKIIFVWVIKEIGRRSRPKRVIIIAATRVGGAKLKVVIIISVPGRRNSIIKFWRKIVTAVPAAKANHAPLSIIIYPGADLGNLAIIPGRLRL